MRRIGRMLFVLTAVIAVCSMSGIASADINYDYAIDPDTTLTTPYSGVIVDNFDSGRPAWTWSGNIAEVSGAASGLYAAPYNNALMPAADPTMYATVPQNVNVSPQSATVSFGGATYDYLGLFWGSIDNYNTIELLYNGSVVDSYSDGDVINPNAANGNQSAPSTNVYVNFVDVPVFNAVRFTSTQYAFEFDNVAVGNAVPVPGAVLLGMLGLSLAGVKLRKKSA